ncbi:MAG TPA: S9 family peptidase [Steroidobacteraceae bacterium]
MTRRIEAVLLSLLSLGVMAPAAAQDGNTGPPPLIDREIFFGDPELAGATLSPDGEHIAFLKPYEGVRNVWVKRTDEPFDAARPVTADQRRPIPQFFWSWDSRYILFVQDRAGDENFNLYAVDPSAEPAEESGVPPARNLTDAENVRVALYALPKKRPDTTYIGMNDRDPAWHDLYEVTLSSGERKLIRENTERISRWVFDLDGELRLAVRSPVSGETEILRVDEDGFTPIYTCSVFETCDPARFHPNGRQVYMVTNHGDADLIRLTLLDVETGNETIVESDPENRVDLAGAIFSERTDELVGTVYVDDRPRINWRNDEWEEDYETLRARLPGLDVGVGSSTLDESLWIVGARGDVEPGRTYLFDRESGELTLQYEIRERLPREHLASMMPIRYESSDGLEIPAYLTLPKGVEPRNLPTLVVPHGGPWARDSWGYNPLAQFFANRGYAVLQPNFRGSTGYGKAFVDAGNGEWGDAMQDDITAGVKYLIEQGIADPGRVGIFGGSYGGYAVLAGLAFTPDVYAAGVSLVGPSNLLTLLNSIPPYWEAERTTLHERMGDPNDPEDRERLMRQSPLFSADEIRAPLLVIQGANDPRVKKAESEQIVVALRERGFPVEYLLAPDEGHGFARPVNNLAAFAAAERFLAMHLDGRFQEGGSPEVMQRLEEITVDPATVELPAGLDAPPSSGAGSGSGAR